MPYNIDMYNKERNLMLLTGDPHELIKFMKRYNRMVPPTIESAELTMHKSITAVVSLPLDYRLKSKRWLSERGHRSLDDGELSNWS